MQPRLLVHKHMASAPDSDVPAADSSLAPEAAYGKLPFDQFVLDSWQYTIPVEQDQEQWNELAVQWLGMDYTSRRTYHVTALKLSNVTSDDARMPTPDQIQRVLKPHQATEERNRALTVPHCLWIRTCYEPKLTSAFADITRFMAAPNEHLLIDNRTFYDGGNDWSTIFLRMPHIPDVEMYYTDPDVVDYEVEYEPPEEVGLQPLYDADLKMKSVHYLLDKEALQRQLLKVIWLDRHGKLVWWNWMAPSNVQTFEGLLNGLGIGLSRIMEMAEVDAQYREKGVVVPYDDY